MEIENAGTVPIVNFRGLCLQYPMHRVIVMERNNTVLNFIISRVEVNEFYSLLGLKEHAKILMLV